MKGNMLTNMGRALVLATTIVAVLPTAAAAQGLPATPVPRVVGPLAVTAESYPFLAANRLLQPMDLSSVGYTEEEFLVSGNANLYDWLPSGDVSVRRSNVPYTTRILVRRPTDPARFSGVAIVEMMHAPFGQDAGLMWGWAHQGMIERRDAWVGVSVYPSAIATLKKFNPIRYASLSFANPAPDEQCAVPPPGRRALTALNNDPSMEEGVRWDMISQVAALLKSTAPNRPLASLRLERIYGTTQDNVILTYVNAFARHAKLGDGRPAYDGFVIKGYTRALRTRRCGETPGAGDPRHIPRNVGVPVMHLQMEGDFPNVAEGRRADSDEPGDEFRLYEIAGTAHFDAAPFRWGWPSLRDISNGGYDLPTRRLPPNLGGFTFLVPFADGGPQCEPEVAPEQPILGYIFHAAFANMDAWVRRGVQPPRAPRLEMQNTGTATAAVALDRFGNGVGGVRTPYVDVPVATYHMHHAGNGPLCRQFGWEERFDWAQMEAEYGTYANFAAKVEQAVEKAVRERWLTETDGRKVREDLLSVVPAPPRAPAPSRPSTN